MTFEMFKKRLDVVRKDRQMIEEKTDSFISGLDAFVSDAGGVPQSWLLEMVENELKNLVYAINGDLDEDSVQDFVDYYLYDCGEINWEKDCVEHQYDLSKDEDTYNYIAGGL